MNYTGISLADGASMDVAVVQVLHPIAPAQPATPPAVELTVGMPRAEHTAVRASTAQHLETASTTMRISVARR